MTTKTTTGKRKATANKAKTRRLPPGTKIIGTLSGDTLTRLTHKAQDERRDFGTILLEHAAANGTAGTDGQTVPMTLAVPVLLFERIHAAALNGVGAVPVGSTVADWILEEITQSIDELESEHPAANDTPQTKPARLAYCDRAGFGSDDARRQVGLSTLTQIKWMSADRTEAHILPVNGGERHRTNSPTCQAVEIIRERMTPHQCDQVIAGAAIEDALALEPGSLLDPSWVSLVWPDVAAPENVRNITDGFDMATEPTPEIMDRVQAIIHATLSGEVCRDQD